jgi:hemoglobin-like flavoprotein
MGPIRLAQHAGYIFIVRTAMTPTQIDLVQDSFRDLGSQMVEASRVFYEELFRMSPDLRALFPEDLGRQKEKFTQMMGVVVRNLSKVSVISEDITDLGHRHMAYDIDEEAYDIFGEALLRMLDRLLGTRMSADLRDAWSAAYDMVARVMKESSAAARPAESFFARIIRDVMTAHYGLTVRSETRSSPRSSIAQDLESGKVIKLS